MDVRVTVIVLGSPGYAIMVLNGFVTSTLRYVAGLLPGHVAGQEI